MMHEASGRSGRRPGSMTAFGTVPTMPRPPVRRRAWSRWTLFVALVLFAAGCGSPAPPASVPTPSASDAPIRPAEGTSLYDRTISNAQFSLRIPAQYEELRDSRDAVTIARWSRPNPDGPLDSAVAVVVEQGPSRPLAEQAASLELRLREENHEVERTGVAWPDATAAELIQWREGVRGTGTFREVWQLMAQRGDTLYSVVAFGPFDSFDASGLPEVVSTFRIRT